MKLAIIHNVPAEKTNTNDSAPDEDVLDTSKDIMKALGQNVDVFKFEKSLLPKLKEYDVIINFAEKCDRSEYSEDEIARYLEEHDIKFTGAGSRLLTLTMDKKLIKELLLENDIRTPRHIITNKPVTVDLTFPLIVKPCKEHASIGISKESIVYDQDALNKKIIEINSRFSQDALVEEFIIGREINASILGTEILSFNEINFSSDNPLTNLFTYDAKWDKKSDDFKNISYKCPAELDLGLKKELEHIALKVAKIFESHDYTRVDFRVRDNVPFVIDVNPNPCISTDSEFVKSATVSEYDFKYIIEKIIELARM